MVISLPNFFTYKLHSSLHNFAVVKDALSTREVSIPPTKTAGIWGLLHNLRMLTESLSRTGPSDTEDDSDESTCLSMSTFLARLLKYVPECPQKSLLQAKVITAAAAVDVQVMLQVHDSIVPHTNPLFDFMDSHYSVAGAYGSPATRHAHPSSFDDGAK